MASMLYIHFFLMMVFVTCTLCSPVQPVAVSAGDSELQATGHHDTILTEVVMKVIPLIPDMMGKHEQQIHHLTTVVEKMATVVEKLLKSQLTILSERLPVPLSSAPTSIPSTTLSTPPPPMDPCQDITDPRDCQDIADAGCHQSGVYTITSIEVFCEFDSERIGWMVFQKRFDGSVDFSLDWDNYERGFGSTDGEYWAGLSLIHLLTQSGHWQLRIDLEAFDGDTAYAIYDSFRIGDASSDYTLNIGDYSGTAGNSLNYQNNTEFSTKDRRNTQNGISIAGGWWYDDCCYHTHLNGVFQSPDQCCSGIVWHDWKSFVALKSTMMKMRRMN